MKPIPENHPCFNDKARHTHARVHLPVAPACNVQCNFCDRKYDCVNESRPGVTSGILSPAEAEAYVGNIMKKIPNLSVTGIAGPGDPFANPEETLETLERIRKLSPDMLLCVASNGLNVPDYVDRLAAVGTSHVTITVNAVDPEIGKKIYSWYRIGKRSVIGKDGAAYLLEQQIQAIRLLKKAGILVKINCILIPGINDEHIEQVAKLAGKEGADIFNCIPLYQNPGSLFAHIKSPSPEMVTEVRKAASRYLPQMSHCQRCRADAVGLLGEGTPDFALKAMDEARNSSSEKNIFHPSAGRPNIAVTSREGMLVNCHLGEAKSFFIYKNNDSGPEFVEKRPAPPSGDGDIRWKNVAETLSDCFLLLSGGAGERPTGLLKQSGLEIAVVEGLIHEAVDAVYSRKNITCLTERKPVACGQSCSGGGGGCC